MFPPWLWAALAAAIGALFGYFFGKSRCNSLPPGPGEIKPEPDLIGIRTWRANTNQDPVSNEQIINVRFPGSLTSTPYMTDSLGLVVIKKAKPGKYTIVAETSTYGDPTWARYPDGGQVNTTVYNHVAGDHILDIDFTYPG